MKLFQDAGMNDQERHNEARVLLVMLKDVTDTAVDAGLLTARDFEFLRKLRGDFVLYGLRTRVSAKQLFWLRDLKERAC